MVWKKWDWKVDLSAIRRGRDRNLFIGILFIVKSTHKMNIGNYCNKRKIWKVKTFVIETTLLTTMYSGAVGKWMHTHILWEIIEYLLNIKISKVKLPFIAVSNFQLRLKVFQFSNNFGTHVLYLVFIWIYWKWIRLWKNIHREKENWIGWKGEGDKSYFVKKVVTFNYYSGRAKLFMKTPCVCNFQVAIRTMKGIR